MHYNVLFDEDGDDNDNDDSNCNSNSVQVSTVPSCQYFLTSCSPKRLTVRTLQRDAMPETLLSYAVRLYFSHTITATIN